MKVQVVDIKGQATGREVELPDEIFGITPNDHAIYLAVKQFRAAQRQGTHKSKERSEIVGSTRKIKRQKGTGTARAGSIKSPLFRGRGRAFGPKPRDYSFKLNKKVKQLAKNSALSYKAQESSIVIVEDFDFEMPQTKKYAGVLNDLGLGGRKTLLVLNEVKRNVYLSLRNIPGTAISLKDNLNTYSVLNNQAIIMSESAAKNFAG